MSTFILMERLNENKDQKHNANKSVVNLLTLNFATWLPSLKHGAQDFIVLTVFQLAFYLNTIYAVIFFSIFCGIKLEV